MSGRHQSSAHASHVSSANDYTTSLHPVQQPQARQDVPRGCQQQVDVDDVAENDPAPTPMGEGEDDVQDELSFLMHTQLTVECEPPGTSFMPYCM